MNHTKGPWSFVSSGDHAAVKTNDGILIAVTSTENVQLIASAPELLEACKLAIDALRDYANWTGQGLSVSNQIADAVAKAQSQNQTKSSQAITIFNRGDES